MSASVQALQAKRERILERMAAITRLRRGSVTEQYYTKRNKDGLESLQGPYYVWSHCRDGKRRTDRIRADQIIRVRKQIANYKELKRLFEELLDVTEQLTRKEPQAESKRRK